MRVLGCALLASLLVACGAAAPRPSAGGDACRAACQHASDAWLALATRAAGAARPTDREEPLAAEQALDRIEEHAAGLTREPREVEGDEAFALSSAMMDAIDAAGGELPPQLRERADLAAEALLTDRGRDGSARAARDAAAVLEQVLVAMRPGALEQRSTRRALATLGRRAQDAGEAYRAEGAATGDLRADRAESAELPEDAAEDLRDARARAIEASAGVRRECAIERRLSVPTL